jgi:hypothetical protein
MGVTVGGIGVAVGAVCVMASIVWVTIAWTVAAVSGAAGCGPMSGSVRNVMGRQAIMARARMPKMIRIDLVDSSMMNLLGCQ